MKKDDYVEVCGGDVVESLEDYLRRMKGERS